MRTDKLRHASSGLEDILTDDLTDVFATGEINEDEMFEMDNEQYMYQLNIERELQGEELTPVLMEVMDNSEQEREQFLLISRRMHAALQYIQRMSYECVHSFESDIAPPVQTRFGETTEEFMHLDSPVSENSNSYSQSLLSTETYMYLTGEAPNISHICI